MAHDERDLETWLQTTLLGKMAQEEEVMLEITVPMSADTDLFRIGWSLKGVRSHRWIAITTGHAVWSRRELKDAARRLESLLMAAVHVVQGTDPDRRIP